MAKAPRVIVIQRGARRRYAVPRLLKARGLLEHVITDAHRDSALGKMCRLAGLLIRLPAPLKRLQARNLFGTGVEPEEVTAHDLWVWHEYRLRKVHRRNVAEWLEKRDAAWAGLVLGNINLTGGNILYVMGGENLRLLEVAREHGMKVIVDAFISPLNLRETLAVKQRLGIPADLDELEHPATEEHYRRVYALADKILCPSQWVADAMKVLNPELTAKVVICPYGSSLRIDPAKRQPVPRRIFWAGGDWLRKGLDQLAAAADLLATSHPGFEFRAAGITDSQVMGLPRFRNINFLGKLSREQMEREFLTADVFAFPTLSEGMAAVAVEAISAGCPVITTRAAGIDAIRHGDSGMLLESSAPEELAGHLAELCGDRERLNEMGHATRRLAAQYSEVAWSERLGALMDEVLKESAPLS